VLLYSIPSPKAKPINQMYLIKKKINLIVSYNYVSLKKKNLIIMSIIQLVLIFLYEQTKKTQL